MLHQTQNHTPPRRKNHILPLLSLLLCAALLCACGGGASSAGSAAPGSSAAASGSPTGSAPGGYVEKGLKLTSLDWSLYSLYRGEGDTLVASGLDFYDMAPAAFTSSDGGDSWQPYDNALCSAFVKENAGTYDMAVGAPAAGGGWWLGTFSYYVPADVGITGYVSGPYDPETGGIAQSEKDPAAKLYRLRDGEEPAPLELPFLQEQNAREGVHLTISRMQTTPAGRLVAELADIGDGSSSRHYLIVDESGSQTAVITVPNQQFSSYTFSLQGEMLYLLANDGTMHVHDLAIGSLADSYASQKLDSLTGNYAFDVEADGSLAWLDPQGIHRLAQGGTLVQDVVQGTAYAFSTPHFYAGNLLALPDGDWLVWCEEGMFKYEYDPSYAPNTADAITVWALEETHVLRAAVSVFSREHPDVPVSLEIGRGEGGATDEDIIRTLNTRLLAGEAPDVLILDGLPAAAYIGAGMLEDLSGKIDTSGCYENILAAYQSGGGVYGYPALFKMPLLIAEEGDVPADVTLQGMVDLAAEEGGLHFGGMYSMFEGFYAACSPRIFPGEAAVDEQALTDFLEATGAIAALTQPPLEEDYMHGGVSNSGVLPRQSLSAYIESAARYATDILNDPVNITNAFYFRGPQSMAPLPGAAFIPVCAAGVPVGAGNKDIA